MTLGSRIAIMHDGALQQAAAPMEVYTRPVNMFVAGFVGAPAMNFLECTAGPEGLQLVAGGSAIEVHHTTPPGAPLILGVRPQDIEIVGAGEGDMHAAVEVVEPRGGDSVLHVRVAGQPDTMAVLVDADGVTNEREVVGLRFRRDRLHLFDARTELRIPG